jgi:hypothetical protein
MPDAIVVTQKVKNTIKIMKNLKNVSVVTTIAFIAVSILVSCSKSHTILAGLQEDKTRKTRVELPIYYFTWEGWGHYEDIIDPMTNQVVNHHCPGGGLCNFKLKKIKVKFLKTAPLENGPNGPFIVAVRDADYPTSEINNFQVTNNLTEIGDDGHSYTISAGHYPYNSGLDGFVIPVIVN